MKKLLLTASGLFLAASLYIGINSYKNINSVSDLLLANVEALADPEAGAGRLCFNNPFDECKWEYPDETLTSPGSFY